jgi:hypothetical protein
MARLPPSCQFCIAAHGFRKSVADFRPSGDLAKYVDALAAAPYIHCSLKDKSVADVDRFFCELPAATNETYDYAVKNKAVAAKYGKRCIAHEGWATSPNRRY